MRVLCELKEKGGVRKFPRKGVDSERRGLKVVACDFHPSLKRLFTKVIQNEGYLQSIHAYTYSSKPS